MKLVLDRNVALNTALKRSILSTGLFVINQALGLADIVEIIIICNDFFKMDFFFFLNLK